ncbi:unnamed protein product [marine sediment metagenome]|uniref:Uncharacterized protein n=1 Tax=marine sediment metagenome TaxID=412755 RepID=X1L5A5_9ZZZZ
MLFYGLFREILYGDARDTQGLAKTDRDVPCDGPKTYFVHGF